jgi:TrmH family RNA methyltransferase
MIESKQNARLKQLRRALAGPGRGAIGRAGRELVGIEGPNLVAEALRSGIKLDTVFVAQGSEGLLDSLPLAPETEIFLLPGKLLFPALSTETPQAIAALIEQPAWAWADMLGAQTGRAPLVVILAGLQDPGNLGTILRSSEAFGATGIVSLPGTVNEWNSKAVRASAGSVFRVPVVSATANGCFAQLRKAGFNIWTTALNHAEPADRVDLALPSAILIGNEGNGVPAEMAAKADGALMIPCPGPVESLNASVAASVLLYEASRQRSALVHGGAAARKPR